MWKVRERAFLPKTIMFEQWTMMSPCAGCLAIKTSSTGGAAPPATHTQITPASCPSPQARCKKPWPSRGSFLPSWPLTGISNTQTVTTTRSPGAGHKWEVLYFAAHTGINPAFIRPHLAGVSFKNIQRGYANETNNLVVLIHRLLTRQMRFLGSNALCYSRASYALFFQICGFLNDGS